MKRQRGRGRRSNNNNSNNPNRHYESNGPDVKIRGSAQQILDKYLQYARDAQTSGDRVNAENYFQHAEHYARIVAVQQSREKQRREERQQQQEEKAAAKAESETGDNEETASTDEAAEVQTDASGSDTDALKVIDAESGEGESKPASEDGEKPRRRRNYRKRSEEKAEASAGDDGVMKTLSRGRKPKTEESAGEAPTEASESTAAE